MAAYKLVCLENPLLDIQAKGDDALLKKYNLKANDAVLAEDSQLGLYDDLLKLDAKLLAGGAAQNAARGAQFILPPKNVLYLGAVGQDESAATLDKACAAAGLDTEYLRLKDQPTGRCGVVITGNNRSLCTQLGAANHYTLAHLQTPEIWSKAAAADVYYIGGFHLTVCPPAAETLGVEAAKGNKTFVMGMGAPFIPQFFAEPFAKLLPYVDYMIGNETEYATWAEGQKIDSKDLKEVAKAMVASPKENKSRGRTVIITQGTEPTIVATSAGVHEFPIRKIEAGQIVDTNGAGDAFAGGFLAALVQGKQADLKTSVDMGHWLANLSIQELGPSAPPPAQAIKE